jgi:hypothetical protein
LGYPCTGLRYFRTVVGRISGPDGKKSTIGWMNLFHEEKLHILYPSPNINSGEQNMKSDKSGLSQMEDMRNACNVSSAKYKGDRLTALQT